jgi:DNA mismatch repair protein MutS2
MDRHTIQTLEYLKILSLVARYAMSEAGREAVLGLAPLDDISKARDRLGLVSQMKLLLEWGKTPPLAEIADARAAVARARVSGAMLDARALLAIAQTARTARLARSFFSENADRAPALARLASGLADVAALERAIGAAIDEDTNIRDGASPRLKKIRQDKVRLTSRITSMLQGIVGRESASQHLQDSLVTIRSGRYVIPVRVEAKGKIAGIVHDTSQSGATVFIEPMETVELNNALRTLEMEEKDEIARILAALTASVGQSADSLIANMERLFRLDAILAASRFSIEFACTEPRLDDRGKLVITGGRHPILVETARSRGEGVVPLDIALGDGTRGVIITGPNAGGKTVALKTVGVIVLLARTGLHVPSGDGTVVGFFKKVYVDIGDQQSIELSLSTFSSHMRNIIKILADADGNTLVLLDELGAGTDPAEGTALATAMIEDLVSRGAALVATTHHMDLKVLAHENPLLENASMEFDTGNLAPTYRLIQGVPGASHAFEIAARLGMSQETLARARAYCGSERVNLEDLSRDLLEKIRRIEEEEATVEAKHKKADQILSEYERRLDQIKVQEKELRKQALREARSIVDGAKRTAERVVSELKELKAAKVEPQAARAIEKRIIEESTGLAEALEALEAPRVPRNPAERIEAGARVYVRPLASEGVVVGGPDDRGRVEVAVGGLRARVRAVDLLEPGDPAPAASVGSVHFEAKTVAQEIDVRGVTAEEAWELVDKYVDDAALFGLPFVRVIHGKGKGILARRIKEMLSTHPRVKTHRLGEAGEGGTGVTIIEMETD